MREINPELMESYRAAINEYYFINKWSIIPLEVQSKLPVFRWKEYQQKFPTEEEIKEWFVNFQDIGIITGKLSGICVIDIDDATPEANEIIAMLPPTTIVETGRGGQHYYFKYPKDRELRNFTRRIPGMDFRGEGGYVVAPPSIHPNGNLYKFVNKLPEGEELPELPEEVIKKLFDEPESTNKGKIQEILDMDEIPEGQRNTNLYFIAQQLHSGMPKQTKLAWELFKSFAKVKCASTYNEAYLKGELRSIFNSAGKSKIALESLKQNEAAMQPCTWANPVDNETFLNLEFPAPKWIVDKLFMKSGIGMLSGDPASYKTFLFLDLAIALASGTPWLGKFPTKEESEENGKKVWILDKESNPSNLQKRLKILRGGQNPSIGKSIFWTSDQALTIHADSKMWDETLDRASHMGVGVIIMDSFRRFLPGSENDSEITNSFFQQIAKCRNLGISVLFTHHHRKKVKDFTSEASQMIRGSSDILANLDMHLVIEKSTDNSGLLKMTVNKVKENEEMPPFALKRCTDENSLLYFEYQGDATNFTFNDKPKESQKASKVIMELLKGAPLGLLKTQIEELLISKKFTKNAISEGLKLLVSQELALKKSNNMKGKDLNFKYFWIGDSGTKD